MLTEVGGVEKAFSVALFHSFRLISINSNEIPMKIRNEFATMKQDMITIVAATSLVTGEVPAG
jgi:hypothetical protein